MISKENKSDTDIKFEKYFINQAQSEESSSLYDFPPFSTYDINQSYDLYETSLDIQIKKDLFGESKKEKENIKKIFNVIHHEKIPSLFNKEKESTDTSLEMKISTFKRKRFDTKRRRRDNSDNILIKKINNIIKDNGCKFYFAKFPQKFISNISRQANKKLLSMTLLEIFETKEIYPEKELNNYFHNLQVIEKKEITEKLDLKGILDKKYFELFEEYINSKEFIVDEINRLKKKFDKSYIENYIYLSKHFIEFFLN